MEVILPQSPFERLMRIEYRPSQMLFRMLVLFHCLAFVSVSLTAFALWIKLTITLILGIQLFVYYQSYKNERYAQPAKNLILSKDNTWRLLDYDGREKSLSLRPAVFVHRLLIILRFIDEGGRRYCFIFCSDNLDSNNLRRLRVRLRFAG